MTDCQACGQFIRPRHRVLCACGHPKTSHHVTSTGNLTWCSNYAPAGPCKCERFAEAGPAAGVPAAGERRP